jgi:hypothetical protein
MDQATRDALRAFAQRRWDLVARQKRSFVAERYRVGGAAASRAAAQRLVQRWRTLHPEPVAAIRVADLQAHVALKQKLDRAGDGIRL